MRERGEGRKTKGGRQGGREGTREEEEEREEGGGKE